MTTVISRTTARTVVPLVVVVSTALFLQGHNLPGGGFIGGVLAAAAFGLLYVVYDRATIEATVFRRGSEGGPFGAAAVAFRLLFTVGLALAAGGGLVPILLDRPFLTQAVVLVHDVPVYHEFEVASALVFDVGVYCVVVGSLLTVLSVVGSE